MKYDATVGRNEDSVFMHIWLLYVTELCCMFSILPGHGWKNNNTLQLEVPLRKGEVDAL